MATTVNSSWQSTVNRYIDAKIQFDYTIYTNYVRISNVKIIAKRTNSYSGTPTSGSGVYSLVINGVTKVSNGTMSSMTIPNNGSEAVLATYSSNTDINFNGNPSISVGFNASFKVTNPSNSTLANASGLSHVQTFSRSVSPSGINTTVTTWVPYPAGQSESPYEAYLSMKSSKAGYLYIKNSENNIWYRVTSGQVSANAWAVRACGNGSSSANVARTYSFHLHSTNLGETYSSDLDVSYSIPAPTRCFDIVVTPSVKIRVGSYAYGTFTIARPSDLPSTRSGYSYVVTTSSVPNFTNDNASLVYLGSTLPPSSYFKCPLGEDYVLQGFSSSKTSTTVLSGWTAGDTNPFSATSSSGGTYYAVFKRSSSTNTINCYVDGSYTKQAKRTVADAYYYGGGTTSGGSTTYTNETYTPSKNGVGFAGWCVDSSGDGIDYKTIQEALDANFSGKLYAVWSYLLGIDTTPSSTSNLGTISVTITDIYGNIVTGDTVTNGTSYGPYYKDPGTKYSITIKKNSNVDSITVSTVVAGVETTNRYTGSTVTVSDYTTAAHRSVTVYWNNTISFKYGTSNGSTVTADGQIQNTNRTLWSVTTPTQRSALTGSWTHIGWVPSTSASNSNMVDYNSVEDVTSKTYYALYSRKLTFYYGIPGSTSHTTRTQYRNGGSYSSITTPSLSTISKWTTAEGWKAGTAANGDSLYDASTSISYTSTSPINFYAVYSRSIALKYFSSATATTTSSGTRTQYLNSYSTSPSSVTSYALYTQSNYSWAPLGWRTDTTATTASNTQTGTSTISLTPAYNIDAPTYNAVYSRSVSFTYDANGGGTAPSNTTGTQYYNANNSTASTVSLKTANAITRDGYSQTKWALDSPTGTTNYDVNTNYNFPSTSWASNATRTLYAIWVVNEKPGVHINVSGLFQLAAPYIFCKRGTETTASWHKMAPYVWDGSAWRLCGEKGAAASVIKFTSVAISGSSTVATGNGTVYTITASPSNATNQQVVVTVSGDGYFGTNTSTKTQTITLSDGSGTVTIKSNAQGTTSTGTITVRPVVADSDSVSASKSVTYAANVVKFSTITIEGSDTVTSGTVYTVRATPTNATNQNVTIEITGAGYLGSTAGTTSQTITLNSGEGTFTITSTAQNTNGSGTITATPVVAATSGLKATKNITYSATIVKFSTISISGSDTVAQNGTTYTISASPTNAANQSVTVSLTGNGYFDSNTSTTSKNITLVNGTQTVVISSKAGTAGTQGVITATPAVAQTSGLKATKSVTYEATKFTTLTISPDSEQTIAYHGTKTFTVTATPSYAGPQYVYLYDATASAGYTSISGNGVTAGSYTLNSQNTSAVCQYKLTLTNGVGSFIVTNNSSSTKDEYGAVFAYTVLPSSTNTVELSASTDILTLSTNPDAQLTLQSFSDSFDVWRTGSTVNSRWLYANSTTAIPTNTNLPVLNDSDTTTGIQVQGKSAFAGGTADVDLDLTLQNAVLTHTPEEINTITIICQTTMTNGSTTNYYSFKVTMNNQESSVISDLTSSSGRVSTYAPSVSFTDAQKTAIVNAIKSSSNGKTFSLVNTVHGHANYTFSGTVNVQLLSLSIVIGYKAYA